MSGRRTPAPRGLLPPPGSLLALLLVAARSLLKGRHQAALLYTALPTAQLVVLRDMLRKQFQTPDLGFVIGVGAIEPLLFPPSRFALGNDGGPNRGYDPKPQSKRQPLLIDNIA
ncbi:MAG TPA: hypothetical protein VMQ76_13760 [Terracidiphilus sp.]|nr:hypothetical protein [Terracidiphilus sp.]